MQIDPLLLYVDSHFLSPYAMSAFVCLKEKELPFEVIPIDLSSGATGEPEYAAVSITQRVPTLVHEDFCLSESSAICEYVDEVFPGRALYPQNPQARARARQVQAWLRSDLLPLRVERSTEVLFYGPTSEPLSAQALACAERLFFAAESLLGHEQDHILGEWTIADLDLALMLNRLVLNNDPVPARLAAYAKAQWQRPSVQTWVKHDRNAELQWGANR